MNDRLVVSIIICAYNAEAFIGETLESVLAQTYTSTELIVVDDGSTDRTAEIVQAHGSRIRYIFKNNQGLSAARNVGLGNSTGEFIVFFDADDLMPTDRLAHQVAYMQQHPDLGLSFVDYVNFTETGVLDRTHFQTCPRLQLSLAGQNETILPNACEALLHENFGISGTMMIRRRMLSYVPGFDDELRGSEDLNFYYRLARHTRVGIINALGMLRRLHTNNLSHHLPTMLPALVKNYTKLYRTESHPQAKFQLRKNLSNAWMELARYEANRKNLMRAIAYEARALLIDMMPKTLFKSARNIFRAVAIAIGAHVSTDK